MGDDTALKSQGNVGFVKNQVSKFKKYLDNDEKLFQWSTALKMAGIALLSFLIMWAFIAIFLKMDKYFFEANGIVSSEGFEEVFYDYLFNKTSDIISYIALFIISVFFIGIYISHLLLRPFRIIGDYCEEALTNEEANYDPDFFTDLKLLTRFSEFFFNHLETASKNGELKKVEIPKKYTKIHKPVFESSFFLQYTLLIFITSTIVSVVLYVISVELHDTIIQLATQVLKNGNLTTTFLERQAEILNDILWVVMTTHVVMYIFLAFHLYRKVSGPAFGIFATMRAFLKGNYDSRVHLIGYYYLRPQCRKLNKYLDHIQKNLTNK